MFTAIGLFLKDKMFSGTGLVITLFSIIFAFFLFSNSNVILTRLGFQTTTTLTGKLVQTENDLDKAVGANKKLNETVDNAVHNGEVKEETAIDTFKKKDEVRKVVDKIKKTRDDTAKVPDKVLDEKTTVKEGFYSIPEAEYNRASEANIDSIIQAYDQLITLEEPDHV